MRARTPAAGLAVLPAMVLGLPLGGAIGVSGQTGAQTSASAAGAAPEEYRVDTARSHVYVVTRKSGLLSFLGHEHAILATDWDATLCYDDAAPERSRATVVVDTRSLVIDTDSARALAGLGGGPGTDDRREIQRKLLDAERLAAETYPELRFESTAVRVEGNGAVVVQGLLTLRGVSREVELPVRVERPAEDELRLEGELRVRQTDYGIRPETVAAVVKVSDPVDLHIALHGVRTGGTCSE